MSVFASPWEVLARQRHSAKWAVHGPDVLAAWVAEMDVDLAPVVRERLERALRDSDTGYAGQSTGLREAFAGFAERRWGWAVEPALSRLFSDVGVGVTEVLRRLVSPGDGVLVTPPVYNAFSLWLSALGLRPVEVPLLDVEHGGRLDLDGMAAALASGSTRVVLLCSPHNPTGRIHTAQELSALADLAAEHDAVVLADEIHAPLVHPGRTFTPYLTVSDAARATGLAFHSASKAFNLAGLKCSLAVAATPQRFPQDLPEELSWAVGHFGLLAAQAAFEQGEPWLDQLVGELAGNAALLKALLAEQLPEVGYHPPEASFLAWLDCRRLGLGDDPAQAFLSAGQVALSHGPAFGAGGEGWARLNIGTAPATLAEAVRRMATASSG